MRNIGLTCACETCDREAVTKGFCISHYERYRRGARTDTPLRRVNRKYGSGELATGWLGGEHKTPDGRVLMYQKNHPCPTISRRGKPGCYVFRYRLIMEAHLGRYLTSEEVVHHINGDCTDDRIENLQVTNLSEHAKTHNLGKGGNLWAEVKKWEHDGQFKTLREWAKISGIPQPVLRDRIRRGKTLTEVITENRPIRGRVKVTYQKRQTI